jgi:LuxR family maltose regulon positive regulatory protein
MRLVIASRADPPLQLARLRARSELAELRLAELCFTLDEAAQFCNQVMDLDLQEDQVAVLAARTEGWIAGLQMAAISLRSAADPSGFIQSFSSSHRFILDYLVEEVLGGQPEEVQSFLMKTSILDRLTGSLCDAVTGLNNSQEILESLERLNLFIIPLDEERCWYRYHQLFLDLLRKRAQRQMPGEVDGWHLAASFWFEGMGDLEDAIKHALAADDFAHTAILLETAAQPILMRSEIYTFGIGPAVLKRSCTLRPDLVFLYALVLVLSGDAPPEAVESWLEGVDLDSERSAGKAGVIRGYLHFMQGEISSAVDLLQGSLAILPTEDSLFRSVAAYILSCTQVMEGNLRPAVRS